MSLRMTWPPKVPGGRATSYELCPLFTYSIGYGEVYRRFSGGDIYDGEGEVTLGDISKKIFFVEEQNFTWRGSRISQHYLKKIRN